MPGLEPGGVSPEGNPPESLSGATPERDSPANLNRVPFAWIVGIAAAVVLAALFVGALSLGLIV